MATPSPLNSFAPEVVAGQIALTSGHEHNILRVMLNTTSQIYSSIAVGDVVSFADGASPIPQIKSAKEDSTAQKIGIVTIAQKKNKYVSGELLEIATNNTDVYMIASGAVNRGDHVIDGATTGKVVTSTDSNYLGTALDTAADGEFVRIRVRGIV